MPAPRFIFTAPLLKHQQGNYGFFFLEIPRKITAALGRRGPIPILATLNKTAELQASLVPMGNGRHRLQLNSRVRDELAMDSGDPIHVELLVPEKPPRLPLPPELAEALREADLGHTFASFPVGKQNHIISWIRESARPQTRSNRVALTLQVVYRARERAYERSARAGVKAKPPKNSPAAKRKRART